MKCEVMADDVMVVITNPEDDVMAGYEFSHNEEQKIFYKC